MKRPIALLIALTLTASLVACSNNTREEKQEPQSTGADNTTINDEQPAESLPQTAPTYATTSVSYEEGSEYFTGSVQCIQITDAEHTALTKAVDDKFSEIVKSFNKTADGLVKEANETNKDYNEDKSSDEDTAENMVFNYSYYVTAEVTRADSQIFSIKLISEIYTGGAHPSHAVEGLVFDSKTGDLLSLEDLGVDSDIAKDYILNVINESDEYAKENLFEEYKDTIQKDFEKPEDTLGLWLDNRGLVVGFQEYDILPYAAGLASFTVPYSQLTGFKTDYIPEDGFYAFELSYLGFIDKVDLDGDGQLDNISITTTVEENNYGFNTYTLNVKDTNVVIIDGHDANGYTYAEGYFIHRKDGNYVLVAMSGDSDIYLTKLFKYDNDTLREVGSVDKSLKAVYEDYVEMYVSTAIPEEGEESTAGKVIKYSYDNTGFTEKE
ncbi:Protein of unknown function [Pseudobutyrivibrio sp. YE44]|uniref:DUF3298 and DUF4163 domain-containing protein n=1 Tax=Pseudobutyrivibrio sp. YE44 TaxID=1520802 RepID=UPI00087F029A|nr:DUF3298 and DUF4163 domain-containing protein [Pseudobutyrivibrio sp. YE44]SDB48529.1 Protein of unknown function [Pseudobutyrivibrio sp. YE44]